MLQDIPLDKTYVRLKDDVINSALKYEDRGYVDGYVQGSRGEPFAVFVRDTDGCIGLVPIYSIRAI